MNKYEAMFIIKPDLSEDEKKALYNQINEAVVKDNGTVSQANVWAEKRKLCYPIKKYQDGTYYLMDFNAEQEAIAKLRHAYKLSEYILRVLITKSK